MLEIKSVESYEPPKIPTFDDDNSELLKKLPSRWQRNAKVLACIGIMGTITLSSLANAAVPQPSELHHGGAGGAPIYVAYSTEQEITVTLNGAPIEFDVPPIIVDGRTLVPMRAIFEALGMEVEWHAETQTVIGRRDGVELEIQIGANTADIHVWRVTTTTVELDTPAILHNDRVLVPLRFIAEATGAIVNWDENTRNISIITEYANADSLIISRRTHGGGAPSMPFYVVHLTEQEAFDIVLDLLENAGLEFNATPPERAVNIVINRTIGWGRQTIRAERNFELVLFDRERGVAITHVSADDSREWFIPDGRTLAGQVSERFAAMYIDISTGVFYNPIVHIGNSYGLNLARQIEVSSQLRQQLTTQVNAFIDFLHAEGIL